MRNFTRLLLTLVLAASLLLSSVGAMAQGQPNDWAKVSAIAPGSNLAIKQTNGKTIKGTLSSVTDSALTLTVRKAPVEIKREDVQTVHETIRKGSGAKGALIGTGVGAGAGAAVGAIGDSNNDGGFAEGIDNAVVAGLTVAGAGVGALVGYFIGKRGSKRVLVYEAP